MRRVCLLLALLSGGALLAQPVAPVATPAPSRAFVSLPPAPTSFVMDEGAVGRALVEHFPRKPVV